MFTTKIRLIIIFFLCSMNLYAQILSSSQFSKILTGIKLNTNWSSTFKNRVKSTIGASKSTSAHSATINFFNTVAKEKQEAVNKRIGLIIDRTPVPSGANVSAISRFIYPLISNGTNRLGLSQLLLEATFACRIYNKSTFRTNLCASVPKIANAILRHVNENLPGKGLRITSVKSYNSGNYDSGRGLVLVRAITPLYNSRRYSSLGWSFNQRKEFDRLFSSFAGEIDHSLRDFLIKIGKSYYGNDSNLAQIITRVNAAKSLEGAIRVCDGYRKLLGKIQKCTSNHVIVALAGKLMVRSIVAIGSSMQRKRNLYFQSIGEFKYIVATGVRNISGNYIFSDFYRTSQMKNGKRERRGLTYTLLQARYTIFAAEILLNEKIFNLYSYSNKRLLKAMNLLSRFVNFRKGQVLELYFDDDSNKNGALISGEEYTKYINPVNVTSRREQARMFGFLNLVKDRHCNPLRSPKLLEMTSALCIKSSTYNRNIHRPNSTLPAKSNQVIESINLGPIGYISK